MSDFCHVLPWYNCAEWQKVYNELSDPSSNKENALNTLLVWKARCPSLPSGIESTLSLLKVHVEDTKQTKGVIDDQLLRLAYSSAVMRFVNHMLDTETMKGSSLYRAAKNLGVPDWIVDLRHDTAHSNNLPRIELLRDACLISLQWLQQNYWDKYKPNIKNYISGQKDIFYGDVNKINALINLCSSLSICAHPNCKIKNLLDIPNIEMRESIVNDIKDLFGNIIDMSNMKTVSIMSLINIIYTQSKTIVKHPNTSTYVNEAILGEDSSILSGELLYYFSASDFKYKSKLTNSYMQCFQVLLTFLHTNDLLLEFVLALIKITQNSEAEYFKARLSALWLSEILLAIKRSQEFSKKLEQTTAGKKQTKSKKDLKQLYHHWFPSTKGDNLILDIQKPIDPKLTDINFIQPIIATYNPYLVHFIKNLLNLVEPPIPNSVAERVYKLAELISAPEKFPMTGSTIYTADDLKANSEDDDVQITAIIEPEEVVIQDQDNEIKIVNSIWRIASKDHKWSSCPIGQLPWQQDNDVEMKNV